MKAKQAMKETVGFAMVHLHYIGEESGEIAEVQTIRNRRDLGKVLKELEDTTEGTFNVYKNTIAVI